MQQLMLLTVFSFFALTTTSYFGKKVACKDMEKTPKRSEMFCNVSCRATGFVSGVCLLLEKKGTNVTIASCNCTDERLTTTTTSKPKPTKYPTTTLSTVITTTSESPEVKETTTSTTTENTNTTASSTTSADLSNSTIVESETNSPEMATTEAASEVRSTTTLVSGNSTTISIEPSTNDSKSTSSVASTVKPSTKSKEHIEEMSTVSSARKVSEPETSTNTAKPSKVMPKTTNSTTLIPSTTGNLSTLKPEPEMKRIDSDVKNKSRPRRLLVTLKEELEL